MTATNPIRLVRRTEAERTRYVLGIALYRLAELRRLVMPQIHGRSPKLYAERAVDRLEALLASLRGSLGPTTCRWCHDETVNGATECLACKDDFYREDDAS